MSDKSIPKGNTRLLKKSEWGDVKSMQGVDTDVLYNPIINLAFDRILEDFKPKKKIAFVSLCTKTRPYSKSRKWAKFIEAGIGENCDLIISSNSGVIPIEYDSSYPYLNYDAHPSGPSKYDKDYVQVAYKRHKEFFTKFHYDAIIFNFSHKVRDRAVALKIQPLLEQQGTKVIILPTKGAYLNAKQNNFKPYGRMFPDLSYSIMDQIQETIKELCTEISC